MFDLSSMEIVAVAQWETTNIGTCKQASQLVFVSVTAPPKCSFSILFKHLSLPLHMIQYNYVMIHTSPSGCFVGICVPIEWSTLRRPHISMVLGYPLDHIDSKTILRSYQLHPVTMILPFTCMILPSIITWQCSTAKITTKPSGSKTSKSQGLLGKSFRPWTTTTPCEASRNRLLFFPHRAALPPRQWCFGRWQRLGRGKKIHGTYMGMDQYLLIPFLGDEHP